ncbi:hypothetical protein FF011L_44730 [Roseimaritima multifibrata]|uniref:Uncharacterized protein n=1 Tax=Roseimaritima multifibrata TaxID=1930274 RepID=A0A517MLB6_9BACT|nr:hypothetical protein FF011L_44730 [Roseimaritima multifibrata]
MRAAANDSATAKTATTAAPYHRMVIALLAEPELKSVDENDMIPDGNK